MNFMGRGRERRRCQLFLDSMNLLSPKYLHGDRSDSLLGCSKAVSHQQGRFVDYQSEKRISLLQDRSWFRARGNPLAFVDYLCLREELPKVDAGLPSRLSR